MSKRFCWQSSRKTNYHHRAWYHKAYYSLDCNDGVENSTFHTEPSPEEILMKKVSTQQLYEALDHLPPLQARQITATAHQVDGLNMRLSRWKQYADSKPVRQRLASLKPRAREKFQNANSVGFTLYNAAVRYLDELKVKDHPKVLAD